MKKTIEIKATDFARAMGIEVIEVRVPNQKGKNNE